MNIKQVCKKLCARSAYEANRFLQKRKYHVGKYLRDDIEERTKHKLFKHIESKEQLSAFLSPTVVNTGLFCQAEVPEFTNAFKNRIISEADRILTGKIHLLFNNVTVFYQDDDSPNWYRDFKTGYCYVNSHTYDCRRINSIKDVDIKNIWELSRLQWLVAPAIAWKVTRKERYAEFVLKQLKSWIKNNQYAEGPNWNISMEIGIRLVNMTIAFLYIYDCKNVELEDCKQILSSMYLQMLFIQKNKENYLGKTYNHYVGGLIGVFTVSSLLYQFANCKKIFDDTKECFETEMRRQFLADGGSFEGSSCYHGLVGEMFALANLICNHSGSHFLKEYEDRLLKAVDLSEALMMGNEICQIGDNDSGRVICIFGDDVLNYRLFRTLSRYTVKKEIFDGSDRDLLKIFGCLASDAKVKKHRVLSSKQIFDRFGVGVIENNGIKVILCATDAQQFLLGGHTHNDKLSICVSVDNIAFIVDPGSGCYTENNDIHIRFRSVVSHSTIQYGSFEQNTKQVIGIFGNSYEAKTCIAESQNGIAARLEVENCYQAYRKVTLMEHGVVINDFVTGNSSTIITERFVLHPEVFVSINQNHVILRRQGVELHVSGTEWTIEPALFSAHYGQWTKTNCLVRRAYTTDGYIFRCRIEFSVL